MISLNLAKLVGLLTANPAVVDPPPNSSGQVRPIFNGLNLLQDALRTASPEVVTWLQAHVDQHIPAALDGVVDPVVATVATAAIDGAEAEAGPTVAAFETAFESRFGEGAAAKLDQILEAGVQVAATPPATDLGDPNVEGADANAAAATADAASVGAIGKGSKTSS